MSIPTGVLLLGRCEYPQFFGFIKGVLEVAVESVVGLGALAFNVLECLNPFSRDECMKNVAAVVNFGQAVVEDPLGVASAIWNGIAQPIAEDWNNGNYGEAVGRAFGSVAEVVAGAKGMTKLTKFRGKPGPKPVDSVLDQLSPGIRSGVKEVPSVKQLQAVYAELTSGGVEKASWGKGYSGTVVRRSDGVEIGWRESKKHGPTIDIHNPGGEQWKIHLETK